MNQSGATNRQKFTSIILLANDKNSTKSYCPFIFAMDNVTLRARDELK